MNTSASPPFFVVGAHRSGTTMLRLMLNRHPDIAVPFESGFIVDFYVRRDRYGDLSDPSNARRMLADIAQHPFARKGRLVGEPEEILARPIGDYASLVDAVFSAYASARGKTRWGDKTPGYVTEIDTLRALFPNCRIVHLVRDGRDVALSNRNVGWGIHSLPRAADDWRWKTMVGHKVGAVLGDDYLLVRYEELVLEPVQTLRSIARFLDVAYTDDMLSYPEQAEHDLPAESTGWHRNSIRAPDATLVYQWKRRMPSADRIIFEEHAGDALATFGYAREQRGSTLGSRLKNLYFATLRRY